MSIIGHIGAQSPYDVWRWAEDRFADRDYRGAAKALEDLLEVDELTHEHAQVRELLARSYYHSAQLHNAARVTQEALRLEPTNGYLALLMSRTLERSGDKVGAQRYRLRASALGVDA
ncbi:hypothetical protein [Nocardioides gilvus]|uniref:hypothetical protein n=1 Tax=Nocardioides gilvus TaxID=1735589 RepID=UPI000D74FC79|nr:hypothetical protein [Nocardioides gilvus]